jgi:hypothetical protein
MAISNKPKVPRLTEIRFTREQLLRLPEAERELLMRVCLVQNEVLLFQRIWAAFTYRDPKTPLAMEAQAIQALTVLLIIAGKVFEALDGVFRRQFLSSPLSREYLPKFSKKHLEALAFLKKVLGANSMLAAIRNTHAFHYLTDEPLSPYIEAMPDGRVLSIYLGVPDGNTMNPFAAEASFRALLKITGESTPPAALERIQDELGDTIEALFQWAAGVQLVALKKMFGQKPPMRPRRIEADEYLPQDKIAFPFFMAVATNFKPKRNKPRKARI